MPDTIRSPMSIDSFNPYKMSLSGSYRYLCPTDGEIETQRFEKLPKGHAAGRQVSRDLAQADWLWHLRSSPLPCP